VALTTLIGTVPLTELDIEYSLVRGLSTSFPAMLEMDDAARDLAGFVLPESGALIEATDPLRPCVLLDAKGAIVAPVETFFAELQADSRPTTTIRSYGMALLRWWRFLSGWGVAWDRVSRRDARDFARWMPIAPKGFPGALAPPGLR
jgi:hypothetical protein